MKRMFIKLVMTVCLVTGMNNTVNATFVVHDGVWFIDNIDYKAAMYDCAVLGDENSMCLGSIYEKQRNAKLSFLGREEEKTTYFNPLVSGNDVLADMIADEMAKGYSVAAEVYRKLKKHGYGDVSIAGILGNMMNECGGNTLALQPYIYEYECGKHYGLCQWSLVYYPQVNGTGVAEQLNLLVETIPNIMSQFGGSALEFSEITDPSEAGRYFANYYERGGNTAQRGRNAVNAYDWIKEHIS